MQEQDNNMKKYASDAMWNLLNLLGAILAAGGLFGLLQILVVGIATGGGRLGGILRLAAVYLAITGLGLWLRRSTGARIVDRNFRQLKQFIQDHGLEKRLREDVQYALEAYRACPCHQMHMYISSVNPQVGRMIAARGERGEA